MHRHTRFGLLLTLALLGAGQAQKVTLTYWTHVNAPVQAVEKKLIAQYQRQNPGVHVEYVPVDFNSLPTKLTTAFAAGTAPDLFNYFQANAFALIKRGLLAPVDFKAFGTTASDFTKMYQPSVIGGYSLGGTVYGIPHEVSSFGFWTNDSLFKAAGLDPVKSIPNTWEAVAQTGQKLTGKGKEGIVMPLYNALRDSLILDTLAKQTGGALFSGDGKTAQLNSAASVRALQLWGDLVHKYKIDDPKLGPTASTDSLDLFGNGTAAMNPSGGSWFVSILQQQYPSVYKAYHVSQYPTFRGGRKVGADLYGFGLFVPKASKQQAEAWKFARFLEDNGDVYFTDGGLWLGDVKTLNSAATKNFPNWNVFKTAFTRGTFLPPVSNFNELSQIIERAIQRVVLNGQDAKASLDQAQHEAAPLMK